LDDPTRGAAEDEGGCGGVEADVVADGLHAGLAIYVTGAPVRPASSGPSVLLVLTSDLVSSTGDTGSSVP
jgi:hypothetical protein